MVVFHVSTFILQLHYTSGSKKPMAMNKKTLLQQLNGPPTAQLYITGNLYHGNK